jgi:hypothetical protein
MERAIAAALAKRGEKPVTWRKRFGSGRKGKS